ncbi:hypothetical protein COW36_24035 [bacterium (Candidatus Blackallbacteria) CG17_big_fil_post_rev_8_21_14_2_50_48_46]|uniref:Phosphoenolpyruvate synthase n=1 Tax=bacterium (Candidatus Blackallbacteria) CG17_big_fil_post_rev_8_21_14_2_50_48_46 TaxID=2014261 RepID=A0A2M7FWW2_9BACT|nr:MAG: hypothetical protein COW64_18975 [bacterium (Candidatus Blackallbacteria) CG18_big_fil_WC_8_21_14_2_50_49_26]PIW13741.1 MAG: hypothetical protein COW36_24035 [bacterium (Candidatus Blackallbacteria) CG17_big_fil_post_rev_8_21_14_2_50_48_46]PIW44967.1 MAG: hypothetical protein COW20_21665 [bacterium (Candidatus Blackallbacteria) CG13_big_fil_rev_8_21_14_2_50_49_14]
MLYSFSAFTDRSLPSPGRKAESLLWMVRQGLPVPNGACLLPEACERFIQSQGWESLLEAFWQGELPFSELEKRFETAPLPGPLKTALSTFLESHPNQHWAVRSSGLLEDLEGASFAGLYLTRLNIRGQSELEDAIKACWLSQYHERVQHYIQRQNLDPRQVQMGVVLQAMIPAEKSGVLFSVNPLKGRDTEMLIEAVYGLGEALVGGEVTPSQYGYDWSSKTATERRIGEQSRQLLAIPEAPFTTWQELSTEQSQTSVLSPAELEKLVALALQVQSTCGYPVDIEWVFAQNQFWLVQTRPITRLHYQEIAGEWTTADFKDGGVSSSVCTPFMWSLYDYIWEITMPAYLRKTHLLAQESESALWGDMFFGRPYWNVGAVKAGLKALPGFVEREFDTDLGIEVSYEGQGYTTPTTPKTIWHGLKVLSALGKSFQARLQFCESFAPKQRQKLESLNSTQVKDWDDSQFFSFYADVLQTDYFQSESAYFYLIFDNSNVTTLFKDALKPYRERINYLNLISGLREVSHLKQNLALWDLGRKIKADPGALAYWQETPIAEIHTAWQSQAPQPLMAEITAFIQEFGYHSTRELDLLVPRYNEDPSFVFESLKHLLPLDQAQDPRVLNQRQHEAYLLERERLLQGIPFWKRKKIQAQLDQLRSFLWWREELRDLSSRMYERIRHFTVELAQRLHRAGQIASQEDVFFCPLFQLLDFLNGKLSQADFSALIQRNRLYYDSFRNFTNPNEIGSRYTGEEQAQSTGSLLKGVPCSPGEVTARARVIVDIYDADRLEKGDILITRFTDPGWTPAFSQIAGVATETGGLLSHAAVISREYGIPAILAIPGLTQRVKDGQRIRLDGNRGELELLD